MLFPFPAKIVLRGSVPSMSSEAKYWKIHRLAGKFELEGISGFPKYSHLCSQIRLLRI